MALVLNRNRVGVENTSTTVGVPENPLARLMYYLNCMCTVLSLQEPNIMRLIDYDNFFDLADEEKVLLLLLCAKLNPVALTGQCLFHDEDVGSNAGRDNEFYNINAETMTFAASESVIVGEKRVAVKKIMFYNIAWLNRNYIEPMKFFLEDEEDEEPSYVQNRPQTAAYYHQAVTYYHQQPTQNQRPAIAYNQQSTQNQQPAITYNQQPAITYNQPTTQQPSYNYNTPSYQRQNSSSSCCVIL